MSRTKPRVSPRMLLAIQPAPSQGSTMAHWATLKANYISFFLPPPPSAKKKPKSLEPNTLKGVNNPAASKAIPASHSPGTGCPETRALLGSQNLMKFSEVGIQRRRRGGSDGWVTSVPQKSIFPPAQRAALTSSRPEESQAARKRSVYHRMRKKNSTKAGKQRPSPC